MSPEAVAAGCQEGAIQGERTWEKKLTSSGKAYYWNEAQRVATWDVDRVSRGVEEEGEEERLRRENAEAEEEIAALLLASSGLHGGSLDPKRRVGQFGRLPGLPVTRESQGTGAAFQGSGKPTPVVVHHKEDGGSRAGGCHPTQAGQPLAGLQLLNQFLASTPGDSIDAVLQACPHADALHDLAQRILAVVPRPQTAQPHPTRTARTAGRGAPPLASVDDLSTGAMSSIERDAWEQLARYQKAAARHRLG
ncbi:hypothetical protein DIPPA_06762 [Diplonema papillatum]|nr:hypothetical protein DIPPA_05692 [Diplonema papillatum]KAJ9458222.1 hypothetical protein DIPPA_06762 [Diplonema papillatum]